MKKLFLLVLALMLLTLPLSAVAMAEGQTIGTVTTAVYETEELEADIGLTPDSPFYFLKLLVEKIELLLTFSSEAKAEKLAEFAERRLAELTALPEEKQVRYAERLADAFTKALAKAEDYKSKGRLRQVYKAVYDETVDESVYNHPSQVALQKAWEKAPEQAKPALERAMLVSQTGKIRSETVREAVYAPGPNTGNSRISIPPGQAKKTGILSEAEEAEAELEEPGNPYRTTPPQGPKRNR
jgi:hypothetical protein